ncbi:MAG: hypothetical protein R3281_10995 [Balneolaceae bacterium]|nr:hypothetical protein [Balneolaceae bacterium]
MWDNSTSNRVSHTQIKRQLLFLGILLAASFIVSTGLFWIYETSHQHIRDFTDVAWWFVTSSTVG